MSTQRRGIMRLFNSFSLVNLFKNVFKQILMRCWKLAQKLLLSSERFCSNNFEYISTSPTVIYVGQSDSIQMVGCCFTV